MQQYNVIQRRFTLFELIGAIIVMALIMSALFGLIRGIKSAQLRFAQEGKAITVLENVLVRIPKVASMAELKRVLKQEFDAADFARKHELEALVKTDDSGARAIIRNKKHDRIVAAVKIAYEEK